MNVIQSMLIALGVGLLVGAERERRKAARATPTAAGLRTFTIAALAGAAAMNVGGIVLLVAAIAMVTALLLVSYGRTHDISDPGITTEVALVATVLLGGMAMVQPALASSIAVVVTIILAARMPMHRFVDEIVTGEELSDILILAGSTLVILPLLPDRAMGPYQALNPHSIWMLVILVLGINAAGHVVTRALGARLGVPILGLASGFVSSSATIGAMGAWARAIPSSLSAGVAAAVLSSVATYIQLGLVINVTNQESFSALALPLGSAALTALLFGGYFTLRSWRTDPVEAPHISRSFGIIMALGFAGLLSIVLVAAAALRAWFGEFGLISASAIAGMLDVHAATIAVASQVADGRITATQSILPILVACSTSTLIKIILTATAGTRSFGLRVIPCLILMITAAWCSAWWEGM